MPKSIFRPRSSKTIALLGTASFLAIAATSSAQAQVQEVLITGSLIAGAESVGVPIQQLGQESFLETGSVSVADVLVQVQEVEVLVSQTNTGGGGNAQRLRETTIRGITTGAGTESLLMVNGMRMPIQSFSAELIDPSIIAPIAVERVDVLVEGASATYGSDAVAGVINVILRRGFEGTFTQVSHSFSEIGAPLWVGGALYGRQWGSGGVTVSVQYSHQQEVKASKRDYWTLNFEPYGLDDKRRLGNAAPAVVHIGGRDEILDDDLGFRTDEGTRNCANCFSLAEGVGWDFGSQPEGPTASWDAIQSRPGIQTLHDPSEIFDALPSEEHTHAHITFDQIIFDDIGGIFTDVNLFVDGFYSNRNAKYLSIPGASPGRENLLRNVRLPDSSDYPYYPTGAPERMRINYNLSFESPTVSKAQDLTYRYAYGLESMLPFDWETRAYYSKSYVKNHLRTEGMKNENHVSAALGNSDVGPTNVNKPANVPFLNVFCDPLVHQCNSPITLDWISGFRDYYQWYDVTEWGVQFNGPIFELPGGPVQVALLGNYITHSYFREDHQNYNQDDTSIFAFSREPFGYTNKAITGQINIPLVGPANAMPFVESFVVEGGYRYDEYTGGNEAKIWTPKASARWDTGYGLSFRGAWGKAFRAPGVAESSPLSSQIQAFNTPGAQDELLLNCEPVDSLGLAGGVANPGSLDAALNPNCGTSFGEAQPGGILVQGGAAVANSVRGGFALNAEDARSWSVGFNYAPLDGFLSGLTIDFTYWQLKISGLLDEKAADLDGSNDPRHTVCTTPAPDCTYLVRSNPNLPITDPANAVFKAAVDAILQNPRSAINPEQVAGAVFIQDSAITNLGFRNWSGLDFQSRYDFEVGNLGAFHVGWNGTYELTDKDPGGSAFDGNTGGRFPWRARVGWSEGTDGFFTTLFLNHIPGSGQDNDTPPACFWAAGFSAGSCYAGSSYFGPVETFSTAHPGLYVWDLNFGYNTGTRPSNPYLHGIGLIINIRNLLDQAPPFNYETSSGRGEAFWDGSISPLQRYFTFTITKNW